MLVGEEYVLSTLLDSDICSAQHPSFERQGSGLVVSEVQVLLVKIYFSSQVVAQWGKRVSSSGWHYVFIWDISSGS